VHLTLVDLQSLDGFEFVSTKHTENKTTFFQVLVHLLLSIDPFEGVVASVADDHLLFGRCCRCPFETAAGSSKLRSSAGLCFFLCKKET